MLLRKIVAVAAASSGLLLVPALPGQAAPTGGCPYPPNRPALTLTVSPTTITAGQSTSAYGKFSQNGCGIGHATINIQRRNVVNGKASGSWATVTTRTTASNGTYSASLTPTHDEQVRALFSASGGFPTTTSSTSTVYVRDAVSINYSTSMHGCEVKLFGGTGPAKPHQTIRVQSRGASGHFHGWTTLWSTTTNSKGQYSTTHTLTCGKAYNLAVYWAGDSTNLWNRSRTFFGVTPRR